MRYHSFCGSRQDASEDAQESVGLAHRRAAGVAELNSVEWRRPGRGGSHVIFSAPGVREIVSVPSKRPIKPVYRCRRPQNKVRATMNRNLDRYQFTVRPLSKEEGGGYLVEYPDIPGCMSDGETVEEAIANGREALRDCLEVFKESGRKIPRPTIEAAQWRQRVPRTLYSKLTKQAENEGVSINSFVTAIIAEAIGSKQARK
jgi:antitoxin HicB